jgi:hypothetical protein
MGRSTLTLSFLLLFFLSLKAVLWDASAGKYSYLVLTLEVIPNLSSPRLCWVGIPLCGRRMPQQSSVQR